MLNTMKKTTFERESSNGLVLQLTPLLGCIHIRLPAENLIEMVSVTKA